MYPPKFQMVFYRRQIADPGLSWQASLYRRRARIGPAFSRPDDGRTPANSVGVTTRGPVIVKPCSGRLSRLLATTLNYNVVLKVNRGIPEESFSPNKRRPYFILQTSTVRQKAVDAGFVERVGVNPKPVVKRRAQWIEHGASVPARKSPFGSGTAAKKSVEIIQKAGYC